MNKIVRCALLCTSNNFYKNTYKNSWVTDNYFMKSLESTLQSLFQLPSTTLPSLDVIDPSPHFLFFLKPPIYIDLSMYLRTPLPWGKSASHIPCKINYYFTNFYVNNIFHKSDLIIITIILIIFISVIIITFLLLILLFYKLLIIIILYKHHF